MDPTQTPQPMPQPQQPIMPGPEAPQPMVVPQQLEPAPMTAQPAMPVAQPGPATQFAAPAPAPLPPQQPFMQQPMAQMPPMGTMPTQPMSYSSMNSSGGKKKLLLIGAAVVGAIVIGVVGFLLITKLGGVSQADYRLAATDASTSETKLSDLHIAITSLGYSSSSTKTQISNDVDSAKKALTEYNDALKKLSSQKAVKKGDPAAQYKKFKELNDKYVPIVEAYIASSTKILVPVADCTASLKDATTSTTAVITKLSECITTLSAVGDLTDTDLKSMLDTTITAFKSFKNTIEQLNSTPTSDYAKRSQLRTQYYDAEDAFSKRLRDIDSNIEKKFKDNDPQDELRTLSDSIFNASLKK